MLAVSISIRYQSCIYHKYTILFVSCGVISCVHVACMLMYFILIFYLFLASPPLLPSVLWSLSVSDELEYGLGDGGKKEFACNLKRTRAGCCRFKQWKYIYSPSWFAGIGNGKHNTKTNYFKQNKIKCQN